MPRVNLCRDPVKDRQEATRLTQADCSAILGVSK